VPWFKDWSSTGWTPPALIENCPRAYEYPLVDRDPIPQWTFGRVTLTGRRRAPDVPRIRSNGASQAILDARVLTREILAHGPTMAAVGLRGRTGGRPPNDLVMLQPPQRAGNRSCSWVEEPRP